MQLPQPRTAPDDGTQAAVDEATVVAHLPLVEYALAELRGRLPSHVCLDDLRSAGQLALVQASRGFDPARGVPFARFASRRISGAMVDELRRSDWASRSVRARARERALVESSLTARLGRAPRSEELAEALGVSVSHLHAYEEDVHRSVVLSLQALESPGAAETLVAAREPSPEAVLLASERTDIVVDAVAVLPEQMRAVVIGLFWQEQTTAEIALELSVTESRVSQIKTAALKLLRDGVNCQDEPALVSVSDRPGGCVERRRAAYFDAVASRAAERHRGRHGRDIVA